MLGPEARAGAEGSLLDEGGACGRGEGGAGENGRTEHGRAASSDTEHGRGHIGGRGGQEQRERMRRFACRLSTGAFGCHEKIRQVKAGKKTGRLSGFSLGNWRCRRAEGVVDGTEEVGEEDDRASLLSN